MLAFAGMLALLLLRLALVLHTSGLAVLAIKVLAGAAYLLWAGGAIASGGPMRSFIMNVSQPRRVPTLWRLGRQESCI